MGELREVNLELGMPTADAPVRRLTYEHNHSRVTGATATAPPGPGAASGWRPGAIWNG